MSRGYISAVSSARLYRVSRKTRDARKVDGGTAGLTRVRCVSHALLPLEDTAHRAVQLRVDRFTTERLFAISSLLTSAAEYRA